MRILLLTVAGLSSRFSKSVDYPCLKCLYTKNSISDSLLGRMLNRHKLFDKIVIVGGFKYDDLLSVINNSFSELKNKIITVENKYYDKYGSGYSLYVGLKEIQDIDYDEVVFAEGDLFVDDKSFENVVLADRSVMTYNDHPICSNKSVALYFDINDKVHYIYDTSHGSLVINEPFISIYNSAQIWKFANSRILKEIVANLNNEEIEGTNLIPINYYFQRIEKNEYELIKINDWINCNTVDDFNMI